MFDAPIKKVTVIGAGMMGHSIAQEFGQNDYDVTLVGRSREKTENALKKIGGNLQEMVELGLIDQSIVRFALDRIETSTSVPEAVKEADLVIEAVVEDLEIKRDLFHVVEKACSIRTIVASNTSSIVPSLLAVAFENPGRFLVAHYFNPPHLMPLVELVPCPVTSVEIVDRLADLYTAMGKKPIRCLKEAPGFIANRIQFVIWREAFNIVQKGIASPADVDKAVKFSFGRRLGVAGPFEIYEHNDGYDLTLQCEKYMLPDMDTSPDHYDLLLKKVAAGELGEKTGQGFYRWTPEFTKEWRKKMYKNLVKYRLDDLKIKGPDGR